MPSRPTFDDHLLFDVDFDLPRFGGGLLGQFHGQDAVVVLGRDLFGIDCRRKGEGTRELAVGAFDAMVALIGVLFFELAFAGQGQGLVLDAHVDVFELDFGDVGFEDEFVLGFKDVHRGRPGPACARLAEHPGESILK